MKFIVRLLLLTAISIIAVEHCYGQKAGKMLIDSLETALQGKVLTVKGKVGVLADLCYEYREIRPNKGIEYGLKALELAKQNKYYEKCCEICLNLASCYGFYNDATKPYEYSLEALKYCTKYPSNDLLLLSTLFCSTNNLNISKEKKKKTWDTCLTRLGICKEPLTCIKTIGLLGNCYINASEVKLGDSLVRVAKRMAEVNGQTFLAYLNLSRIGNAQFLLKKYDSAIATFLMVNKYLSGIGDKRLFCENEGILAKCYLLSYRHGRDRHKLMLAKAHLKLSLNAANDLEYLSEGLKIYGLYDDVSFASGEVDSAYKYLQLYVHLNDSLYGREASTKLQQIAEKQRDEIAAKTLRIKDVELEKRKNLINSALIMVLLFLVATVLIFRSYHKQKITNELLAKEKQRSEDLLLNILPAEVAEELKDKGTAEARHFDNVTVLFTDFVNFTEAGERMTPKELVNELHCCFKVFDEICEQHNIEKIKTVGDAYLAVSGLPVADANHAQNVVLAAKAILQMMSDRKAQMGSKTFEIRIGINSGSVVAGIVGVKKFAYDIWGDTVNTAARMEQNSEAGRINISGTTYALVKHKFHCTYRGEVTAKNKGALKMYFVE